MSYPTVLLTKQIQSAIILSTFNALGAGISSNAELTNFLTRVLFAKNSDTTVKFLGKAILYDFIATSEQQPIDFHPLANGNRFNLHNVGQLAQLLNIALPCAPA